MINVAIMTSTICIKEDVNSMVEEEAITSTTDDAKRKKMASQTHGKRTKKTYKKLTVMQ